MAWTSIINGQTGQEVSDKLDVEFGDLENDISDLQAGKSDNAIKVLDSSNFTNQIPTGLGVALNVKFGDIVNNDYLFLDSDGSITFKQSGHYHVYIRNQYGRVGSVGVSLLMGRYLINGAQEVAGSAFKLDGSDVLTISNAMLPLDVGVNDVLVFQTIRDSSGDDSGGLYATTSSHGWTTVPSSHILISKIS